MVSSLSSDKKSAICTIKYSGDGTKRLKTPKILEEKNSTKKTKTQNISPADRRHKTM